MTGSDRTIVHVAQIEISRESGMGRVAWHWRRALEERGFRFVHVGPREAGAVRHPALFPAAARRAARRLGLRPAAYLVHEPAGSPFVSAGAPLFLFSHGLERRGWEAALEQAEAAGSPIAVRSRLLFPLWRLRPAERAIRRAEAVLVLNRDDLEAVQGRYGRKAEDCFLYRNGVDPAPPGLRPDPHAVPTLLFLGSWLERKGISVLLRAAEILRAQRVSANYLLAGTGVGAEEILSAWPAALRGSVRVLPTFPASEEANLYAAADVFVLPSYFEGQPLSLLQAMAAGCCCLASRIGGNRDLLAAEGSGLLHRAGDAEELAAQLAECLTNGELRARLGEGARSAVAGRGWEAVAGEVADFIAARLSADGRSLTIRAASSGVMW